MQNSENLKLYTFWGLLYIYDFDLRKENSMNSNSFSILERANFLRILGFRTSAHRLSIFVKYS